MSLLSLHLSNPIVVRLIESIFQELSNVRMASQCVTACCVSALPGNEGQAGVFAHS